MFQRELLISSIGNSNLKFVLRKGSKKVQKAFKRPILYPLKQLNVCIWIEISVIRRSINRPDLSGPSNVGLRTLAASIDSIDKAASHLSK